MGKRRFGETSEALYRTEKFEIRPTKEEYVALLAISGILRGLFNSALEERRCLFAEHITPLYERLRKASEEEGIAIRQELKAAYREHSVTFFDQINTLTARRASDEAFASVPRNWQEETLDAVDGAMKSFVALRKNGDLDARPPRMREGGFFQKIPGRFGFRISGGKFVISCGERGKLTFPIPAYQEAKLAKALAFKKFELYRDRDARFFISVAYELPRPETDFFSPERAVYLALGASSIGVLSPYGEEILPLWRSDKHWMPKIESLEQAMKVKIRGSTSWRRLEASRNRMHQISSRQRLQDEREVVDYLIRRHGHHFVVTDLVVRSKEGKLADSRNPERGGSLGLNWAAQNTGSLSRLVLYLKEKVREWKGSVRKHKLILEKAPPGIGAENKLWIAKRLRESFLEASSSVV